MAVPAAVVRDGGTISAVGAFVEMAAKCGGTTPLNGSQHLDMLPTKPVAISFDENLSRSADDIGHLQRRPAHLLLAGRSEEHTSELQSRLHLVCRLLPEKKKITPRGANACATLPSCSPSGARSSATHPVVPARPRTSVNSSVSYTSTLSATYTVESLLQP